MIRAYANAVLAVAVLGALAWGTHRVYQAGADSVRAEWAQANEVAAESARLLARERVKATEGVDRATVDRQRAAALAAAADRSTVGQLRDALADATRASGDSATTSCADERRTIGVLAGLVSESAELLAEGAAVSAGLATQSAGLREYVTSVCQMPLTRTP
jgi:hypothetical protein